jgi:probable rRNA maturation factor
MIVFRVAGSARAGVRYGPPMKARNPKPRILISSSQRAVRVDRRGLARLARFVARAEGQRLGELDLAVVGKDEIAGLNRRWLSRGGATDVLSFDLSGAGGGLCAQLVVCGEVAREQGRRRGLPVQRELMLYVVHGLLHLMGYEDHTIRGAAKMHAREEELLRVFLRETTKDTKDTKGTKGTKRV